MGAQGTATINFGAMPGTDRATLTITGQAGIVAGSAVEAWPLPKGTADHSADEQIVEPIQCDVIDIVAGTGFTIVATPRSEGHAFTDQQTGADRRGPIAHGQRAAGASASGQEYRGVSPIGLRYGLYDVAWVWN